MRKAHCFVCSRRKPLKALRKSYGNVYLICRDPEACNKAHAKIQRRSRNRSSNYANYVHFGVQTDWCLFGRKMHKPNNLSR